MARLGAGLCKHSQSSSSSKTNVGVGDSAATSMIGRKRSAAVKETATGSSSRPLIEVNIQRTKKERKLEKMMSLMDLNDDCLRHVCSYLGTADTLSVVLVCDREFDIIREIDWGDFLSDFTAIQIEVIFSRIGNHLQKINYQYIFQRKFRLTSEYDSFTYLNKLTMKYCPNVVLNMNLNYLSFGYLTDSNVRSISALSQLRTLDLSGQRKMTGKYLDKLKNLVHLNLGGCFSFESVHFIALCKVIKLKTLHIHGCELDDTAIEALVKTQTDLEEIKMGDNAASNLEIVCQLKSLKSLELLGRCKYLNIFAEADRNLSLETLRFCERFGITKKPEIRQAILKLRSLKVLDLRGAARLINDHFVKEIALNFSRLEEFRICDNNEITDVSIIIEFVKNVKNLRVLGLRFWKEFDKLLFKKIVAVMKEKKCSEPLIIIADFTAIECAFLKEEVYRKTMNLVVLSFGDVY